MKKESKTKRKIKECALELFNDRGVQSITTNHIASHLQISPGNLYYYYKNKEAIIYEIYQEMSHTFESFESFEKVTSSPNPLKTIYAMFDAYIKLFWQYRFLMRDASLLMAQNEQLKQLFSTNQSKRIMQIEGLLKFLIAQGILKPLPNEDIALKAKLHWFVWTYWQGFASLHEGVSKQSIGEVKEIIFKFHILPFLSRKGTKLLQEFYP
jgi:AcrR family transcriptional regulator